MIENLDQTVYRFRAIRSLGVPIEDDPDPMVQQQLARLKFAVEKAGVEGWRILDWGCGSGFNCAWLRNEGGAREVMGFDLSEDAIRLASEAFPGTEFVVADACDPALSVRPGEWDRIFACEVFEHVPDVPTFLANLRRHLADDGIACRSTPNRLVFSLGHEPLPINREHIKEPTLEEFLDQLSPHFSRIEVYGQNFRTPELLEAWKEDVRRKTRQLEEGTRWVTRPTLRQRLRRNRLIDGLYHVAPLRAARKFARWTLIGGIRTRIDMARSPYTHRDFEFVSGDLTDSVWFCAILRP